MATLKRINPAPQALLKILLCVMLLFILPSMPISAQEAEIEAEFDIEEMRRHIIGESPQEVMAVSLGDAEVSLFLTGSWMGNLQLNAGFFSSPIGAGFISPETPLLFTQEADLTLSLWINNRWFVEASFLDGSGINTYRAGYQGQEGEFIQYAGIGNTGLDFPSFAYLDLGGDSPSSFGFYSRFGTRDLTFHTLFRYDSAARDERIFTGGRERTFSYVPVTNFLKGVSFVLPDTNIDSQVTVFIEDANGPLRDLGGRRWRIAGANEFAVGRAQGLVELRIRPQGMVAVAYSIAGNTQPWVQSLGSYSSGDGFLGEVQEWFFPVDMTNFPAPRQLVIGGVHALVIREPGIFSPFERQNRYEAVMGTAEQVQLVRLSTGTEINTFLLVPLAISTSVIDIPLYEAAISQLNVFELLPASTVIPQRHPAARWPLAGQYPEIYLTPISFTGDVGIRFTNFSAAGGYFIGADVVPGSIQVWRSGIQDTNFSYNRFTGEVVIHGAVGANELIRITFLRQSEETRLGSIAAGFGAVFQRPFSPFSVQAALGLRWNLTEADSFSEEGASSPGTVGLSVRTAWEYDYLQAHIAAAAILEQVDTTGLYRVAGMSGNETVVRLPPETSFISNPPLSASVTSSEHYFSGLHLANRAGLIFRNYLHNTVLGSTLMTAGWSGAAVVSGVNNRPYPVRDPQLTNVQSLAAEFVLNDSFSWTGFQVPLGFYSEIISRAGEIEIPFRLFNFTAESPGPVDNFRLIVQIGSLSGEDFAHDENLSLIWERELFSGNAASIDGNLRTASFQITDDCRQRLADARYMRLIAVYSGIGEQISGRVIVSPPIVRGAAFRPVIFDGHTINMAQGFSSPSNRVSAFETIEIGQGSLENIHGNIIRRLNPVEDTQRVLRINWENMKAGFSAGVDSRLAHIPLSDYRSLSFFVRGPEPPLPQGTLSFYIAPGPSALFDYNLRAEIPLSAFEAGQWSKVTIRYRGSSTGVEVNGVRINGAQFRYRPLRQADTQTGRAGYVAILVNPPDSTQRLQDAVMFIDEIILEEPNLFYRFNLGGSVSYSHPFDILSIGAVNVLSDFSIFTAVESEFRMDPVFQDAETLGSMAGRTGAGLTVLGARINGNILFTMPLPQSPRSSQSGGDDFIWSADHGISRSFGPLTIGETFYASPADGEARHTFNLDFSSPFFIRFNSNAFYNFSRLERRWNLGSGFLPANILIPSVSVNTLASWITNDQRIGENESYGNIWLTTWEQMMPDTGSGADNRRTLTQITLTQRTRPVGAALSLNGNTNFTLANSTIMSENSAFLDVPVILNRSSFNFRAGRTFQRQLLLPADNAHNDVFDDWEIFFEGLNDSRYLWAVIPGYSLFSGKLNNAMDRTIVNSPSVNLAQYTSFNDHFSTRAVFPRTIGFSSFVIPSSAGLRFERVLEQKLDTGSDVLNLGASLGFSAVNMFGLMGYRPVFTFYQNDEFSHSIESAVIFPKDDDPLWRIQSTAGMAFRGFYGGVLNFVNTFTIRSTGEWLESASLGWTMPTQRSLLSIFFDRIAAAAAGQNSWPALSGLLNSPYEQLRTVTMELAIENSETNFRTSLSLGHESIIRILGRLNFSAFVKLRLNDETQSETFTMDALLGTVLRLNF